MNGFITFIMLIVVTIPLIALQCFHTDKMLLFPQSSFVFFVAANFLILHSHSNSSHSTEARAS